MIDSLTIVAHETGYLRGLVIGGAVFGVLGVCFGFMIAAILQASAHEPPGPATTVIPFPRRRDEAKPGFRRPRGAS